MSVCYLVGAGEFNRGFTPREDDFVIAADGGYDNLQKIGITPNLIIGDSDSIDELPLEVESLKFPKEKNETDMFLAYMEGCLRGYHEFYIYGGQGGREDHTFANYALLLAMARVGKYGELVGDKSIAFVLNGGSRKLAGQAGKTISVFPIGADATGVTIKGLKYEAENITMKCDFPIGVSNEFAGPVCEISVESGALLIIAER